MFTTLFFYFSIAYNMLTIKKYFSSIIIQWSPLLISPSSQPLNPQLTTTLFFVLPCLFLFGLVCCFILFVFVY